MKKYLFPPLESRVEEQERSRETENPKARGKPGELNFAEAMSFWKNRVLGDFN